MYIITVKEDNRIIAMGAQLDYMENGYPRLVEENIAFPTQMVNVNQVIEVPAEIEPEKYCYNENDGFYKNTNYKRYYSEEERISALEDAVDYILMGGIE